MDQETLAEVLGVSVDTLKSWRTRRMAKSPLFLKPDLPPTNRKATYSHANVARWLMRNPDYKARVIALLAPEPLHNTAQPVHAAGLGVIIPTNYQLQGESA
jgi:hypothetical protein